MASAVIVEVQPHPHPSSGNPHISQSFPTPSFSKVQCGQILGPLGAAAAGAGFGVAGVGLSIPIASNAEEGGVRVVPFEPFGAFASGLSAGDNPR